ncbi:MAG: glycosyltransferase family 1 protein [Flavobacteriaceae bacterium]|nr:glycosyltransferase family 1 protein [Flavobacteriaceae bacterium]
MKILLVGEYSRLHNSLKEGLLAQGHEVTLIATGDLFKKFPSDIPLFRKYDHGLGRKLKILVYALSRIDLTSIALRKQFRRIKKQLVDYDVVQLINELPFGASLKVEREIFEYLRKNNKKLYLLSCGNDHISVKYAFEKKFRYSILSPYFEGKLPKANYKSILKYIQPKHKDYHDYLYEQLDGVIASDLDYHIPLQGIPKYLGLIPNPVNLDQLDYQENLVSEKVVIFHGINRRTYFKKGSDYFEAALEIIQNKYPDKVEVLLVENLPYEQYIKKYDQAHIVLDQVLAYDQGYNALEAMAKGKVVFTGAEQEFVEYYNLNKIVAINALPDVDSIVANLEDLIIHPEKIHQIGRNARDFIERYHDYRQIANTYVQAWTG